MTTALWETSAPLINKTESNDYQKKTQGKTHWPTCGFLFPLNDSVLQG